jgi:hypothetical protein
MPRPKAARYQISRNSHASCPFGLLFIRADLMSLSRRPRDSAGSCNGVVPNWSVWGAFGLDPDNTQISKRRRIAVVGERHASALPAATDCRLIPSSAPGAWVSSERAHTNSRGRRQTALTWTSFMPRGMSQPQLWMSDRLVAPFFSASRYDLKLASIRSVGAEIPNANGDAPLSRGTAMQLKPTKYSPFSSA